MEETAGSSTDSGRGIEIKVGVLVFVALVLLAAFILALGNFSMAGGKEIHVDMESVGDVKTGAPVKIAGMTAGRVKRIRFLGIDADTPGLQDPDILDEEVSRLWGRPLVRFTLHINRSFQDAVRQDSLIYVASQGLLGERYIEIDPGSPEAPVVAEDALLRGWVPPRPEKLLGQAGDLIGAFSGVLEEDPEAVASLLRQISKLLERADRVLAQLEEGLTGTLHQLEQASKDGAEVVATLKESLGDGAAVRDTLNLTSSTASRVSQDLGSLLTRTEKLLEQAEEVGRMVQAMGEREGPRASELIQSALALTRNGNLALEDLRNLTAQVNAGDGALTELLHDKELYDDLKTLVSDLKRHPWKLLWKP